MYIVGNIIYQCDNLKKQFVNILENHMRFIHLGQAMPTLGMCLKKIS